MKFTFPATALVLAAVSLTAACQPKAPEAPSTATMNDEQKAIYAYGAAIGQQVAQQNKQLRLSPQELDIFRAAFSESLTGKEPQVKIADFEGKFRELAQARLAAAAADTKKAGEEFLAKAATQQGAVKTDSGLVFRTITPGKGDHPKATDVVKVNYHGTLPDGKVFDSSVQRGEPAEFALNRVIPCWTEGVQRMQVGEKAQLVCPAALAYGDRNAGDIPPGSTLNFEVELLEIKPQQ